MEDQLTTTLQIIFDILKSTVFFAFIYGIKAYSFLSQIVGDIMHDDNMLTKIMTGIFIIFMSYQTAKMAYRSLVFWFTLVFNVLVYGGLVFVGVWIYSRGFGGAREDAIIFAQFWKQQYDQYANQARAGRDLYGYLQGARDAIVNEQQRAQRAQGGRYW